MAPGTRGPGCRQYIKFTLLIDVCKQVYRRNRKIDEYYTVFLMSVGFLNWM